MHADRTQSPVPSAPVAAVAPHVDQGASLPHVRGVCHALFAYDVGLGIDLDHAERLVRGRDPSVVHRDAIRHLRRTPEHFAFTPVPVRVQLQCDESAIGPFPIARVAEAMLFDFGAVSIAYQIPFAGPLDALMALSEALYQNPALLADSRRRLDALLATLAPAVSRMPGGAERRMNVEDYAIVHVHELTPDIAPATLVDTHAGVIARILRAERAELSHDEVRDALSTRISYSPRDLTLIDWNSAIVVASQADDILAVLEFANVELLELRQLDDDLDHAMEAAQRALRRRGVTRLLPLPDTAMRQVAELQAESSLLFENVNNALKLLGDQYLARLYRLAADRLHLPEWDRTILRKLQTLDSVYQKLVADSSARRLEVLEWIVIILIATEIVLALTRAH